jgi:hypothetical protein
MVLHDRIQVPSTIATAGREEGLGWAGWDGKQGKISLATNPVNPAKSCKPYPIISPL